MRNMTLVTQQKLQGVLSGRQVHFSLGLACTEVEVIEIVWNWLIQRRRLGIDQQMVVPGILSIGARRCHSHTAQPKMNGGLGRKGLTILQVDEIDRGSRR